MTAPKAAATVAIVGGGPAGLMAAERLAMAGLSVTIYERMPSVGRKLLMAGRGGLNLTHSEPLLALLGRYSAGREQLEPMIEAFPPDALVRWANGLGIETFVGTSGRVFPKAMKASPLLRAWLTRLDGLGVTIRTRQRWTGFDAAGALRFIGDDRAEGASSKDRSAATIVKADAVILALGGASWPRLGADGRWVAILRDAGVAVADLTPANVGVRIAWSEVVRERFQGEALKRLAVSVGAGARHKGEAVVTATGLEGGAIYAVGADIRAALARDGHADLSLDFRPDLPLSEVVKRIGRPRGKQSMANHLRKAGGLPPVASALVREAARGPLPADAAALARLIKGATLRVDGLAGMARAISAAGGVRFEALDAQLMLTARPGVFLAGEMLDWDAPTGGYLLQGCMATGVAAAGGVRAWLKGRVAAVSE